MVAKVMSSSKLIAMIPARIGSTRLKMKNLALIAGKPMIAYAIESAKASGVFNKVVLNSDSHVFEKIAEEYECEFYLRPENLGKSSTKSEFFGFRGLGNPPLVMNRSATRGVAFLAELC